MSRKIFPSNLSDFFKALGNDKRQEILLNVFSDFKEHNIGEVAKKAGIAQSTASEHLSFLKRAGILTSEKVEKEVFYRVDRESVLSALDEIRTVLSCCMK
ncbi:MAG TPA: metalloregulator ArsR/SmtB family transcription factor [Leptospiraceae bacterium]|nr:metalloregulator ArsR/SmtB family transcription factor [Leptospiraceae bacterium]HMY66016.1 metalloregulator ArsR/SmtB family transcription factor [Leptospiraceae bacterium]HMZ58360.1 metalloregulator ArsR/SmtB family transcription factor [Leptospiraceae bacterium]HNF15477.1 metalloregulator ArsR/SmtB family transcription factor [Leptospiraceae bacterium]HNF26149.1 metalloregulator ArsR/SmtB family transcription factor [Leptospiraceae bacterium]